MLQKALYLLADSLLMKRHSHHVDPTSSSYAATVLLVKLAEVAALNLREKNLTYCVATSLAFSPSEQTPYWIAVQLKLAVDAA